MLPFFAQEFPTSCVAACVRMVLAGLGHALPESAIRTRCGYTKLGLRLSQVGSGLADLPVVVEYHIDWSLDDVNEALHRSTFPIVGIDLRPIEGTFGFHAVVVLSMSSSSVVGTRSTS